MRTFKSFILFRHFCACFSFHLYVSSLKDSRIFSLSLVILKCWDLFIHCARHSVYLFNLEIWGPQFWGKCSGISDSFFPSVLFLEFWRSWTSCFGPLPFLFSPIFYLFDIFVLLSKIYSILYSNPLLKFSSWLSYF